MGQIYSFLGYGNTTGNNDQEALLLGENFSCKICLEVLHDPVQCQNNEHYFCRGCITKHLGNSETCPLCMEQLTLETLRPPSRIVASVVSQLKKPRCSHVSRGCEENVEVKELLLHEQTCGYAPVVCSNEGCKETVNRRDKESHETEECKFRKITCEFCDEELVYVDYYKKHQCSLTLRKEMKEVKSRLDEVTESLKQVVLIQDEMLEKQKTHDQSIKDLQNPLRHFSSATIQRDSAVNIKGQIFIFSSKSLEVFNWSTKAWTLIENCLFFSHRKSFSFLYGKRIMVCGGSSNRIEFLVPSENGFTSNVFPGSLPSGDLNGVLFENRIITFGWHVQETSLERPWKSTVLIQGSEQYGRYSEYDNRGICALECFGNEIFVIGFSGNKIERYDIANNKLKTLTTLPYTVYNMATVAYKDNIIILGGQNRVPVEWSPLNDVLMYNIHSLECKRLPSMLEKRSNCAAVIMGDVIVVMGGEIKTERRDGYRRYVTTTQLKTVEYYVIGDTTWQKLPAMNDTRARATACVYV
ncbi:E3 ubiquitin- ligase PDZRN3 [Paramuricea clavata]|uniref:E3 ubiquitin- ligase PDZRN3 n=1 Tax=Paramuricea clavata TaxID=317549 RepID=A0A6S7FPL6_PARCT|nr:E3 ubiquitin- ligase PDZRN3 [Paramuricea clavata]